MNIKPCRVTYKQPTPEGISGLRFQIEESGRVWELTSGQTVSAENTRFIRLEAARQRRNRNARERNQAMRDLGMKHTSYEWE